MGMINEITVVETKEIEEMAREIEYLTNNLDLLRDYFSLLATNHRSKTDHDSLVRLHLSLFHDDTLNHMDQSLENTVRKLDDIAGDLFEKSIADKEEA